MDRWLIPLIPSLGRGVRIISPANHQVFFAPVDIPILAYVVDAPDVTNVSFYANSNYLGSGFRLGVTNLSWPAAAPNLILPGRPVTLLGAVYCFVWTNAPPGLPLWRFVIDNSHGMGSPCVRTIEVRLSLLKQTRV